MKRSFLRRSTAGFTLIELLVVMVIVGMMSALVLPRLAGSLETMSLKTSARKVSSTLRFARSHAVTEGKTMDAVFDFDSGTIILRHKDKSRGDQAEKTPNAPIDKQLASYQYVLPDGVTMEKAVLGKKEISSERFLIRFYPTGGTSGGKIFLKGQKEYTFKIEVDRITGTVALE